MPTSFITQGLWEILIKWKCICFVTALFLKCFNLETPFLMFIYPILCNSTKSHIFRQIILYPIVYIFTNNKEKNTTNVNHCWIYITTFKIDTRVETLYPLTSSTHLPASFSPAVTSSLDGNTDISSLIVTKGEWEIQSKKCFYVHLMVMFNVV